MVEIQVLPVKGISTILAGVFVAFKNVVTGELDLLLRNPVENEQENHPWHTDAKGNRGDGITAGLLLGKIVPFIEGVRAETAIVGVENRMGMSLKQECQSASGGADIDSLPQPVEHQHMLGQLRFHRLSPNNDGTLQKTFADVNLPELADQTGWSRTLNLSLYLYMNGVEEF